MKDLTGEIFGGYELEELIGTGGMASIYKATDETLSRAVAIKVVPTYDTEQTMLERFRLEAKAIAALRHRNILAIYGYGEEKEKGWAYIVMEYVPGGSLKDRMTPNQPFTWQRSLEIIIPVSQALEVAHKHGIIHRDIKPANILMTQDEWPLLADFGLAKMEQSGNTPNLTMPGQVLGTMAYAAPEQIQEGNVDCRADIYALGIVLYELLTGILPFEGETSFDFLMARLTDPPKPLLEANSATPPIFVPVLDKALAQEADDRYQTMTEFYKALIETRDSLIQRGTSSTTAKIIKDNIDEASTLKVSLKLPSIGQEISASGQTELIIGRSHKNIVPSIDLNPYGGSRAGVSRRHSRLLYKDGQWFLEDLASTNGTFINNVRLSPNHPTAVKEGDLIRCGHVELEFKSQ